MYLMIRDEESIKVVKNICLIDGYLPSVDSYSPIGEDGLPEIEPGIWFKTDVFAGVLVDCNERVLKWTTEDESFSIDNSFVTKSQSDVDFGRFTRHLYEGECYDFETGIDDLFNTAACLLEKERARSTGRRRKQSFNSSKMLIRILNCHILPAIKLRPSDLNKVEGVYKQQEKVLQLINVELEKMSQDIENTKLGIQFKRESMVKEFQSLSNVEVYPRDILLLLETQIQGDVERESRALDRAQEEVNRLKSEPKAGELLVKKRKKRDYIFEKQVTLITARENVVQVLQAMAKKNYKKSSAMKWQPACTRGSGTMTEEIVCTRGNKDLANQYVMYMKVNDLLQEQRNKRFILTSKLEFILSVRETINEALQDLRSGKESVGFSRDRTKTGRSTDILRHTNIPEEWLTLTEKVGDLLMEGDNPLRKRHCDFVSQIRDKFLAAINVAKVMLDRGQEESQRRRSRHRARSLMHKEFKTILTTSGDNDEDIKSQTASILRTRAMSSRSFKRRMDSLVGMPVEEPNIEDDEIQEQIGNEISFLSQQIHAHFDFMSSELQIATDQYSDTAYYKTWLCYEGHFYRDTMDRIMELYKLNYRQVCNNLEKNASHVTTEDLGIEDQWLMNFFVKRPDGKLAQTCQIPVAQDFVCWSKPPLNDTNESTAKWAQSVSPGKESITADSGLNGVEMKTVTKVPYELKVELEAEKTAFSSGLVRSSDEGNTDTVDVQDEAAVSSNQGNTDAKELSGNKENTQEAHSHSLVGKWDIEGNTDSQELKDLSGNGGNTEEYLSQELVAKCDTAENTDSQDSKELSGNEGNTDEPLSQDLVVECWNTDSQELKELSGNEGNTDERLSQDLVVESWNTGIQDSKELNSGNEENTDEHLSQDLVVEYGNTDSHDLKELSSSKGNSDNPDLVASNGNVGDASDLSHDLVAEFPNRENVKYIFSEDLATISEEVENTDSPSQNPDSPSQDLVGLVDKRNAAFSPNQNLEVENGDSERRSNSSQDLLLFDADVNSFDDVHMTCSYQSIKGANVTEDKIANCGALTENLESKTDRVVVPVESKTVNEEEILDDGQIVSSNPGYLETDIDAFFIEEGRETDGNVDSGFMFLGSPDDKIVDHDLPVAERRMDAEQHEDDGSSELTPNGGQVSTADAPLGVLDGRGQDKESNLAIGTQMQTPKVGSGSHSNEPHEPEVKSSGIDDNSYSSEESVDFPGDANRAASEVVHRSLKPNQSRLFMETFAPAIACVEAILKEYIPLNKLQLMTKCVRLVQKIVAQIQSELSADSQNVMCCDDFLTIIPLVLLHTNHTSMAELYPHIIMLMDLMAPFLSNGIHSNSLTHFYGAYQILFSMMVVQTKPGHHV